MAVDMYLVIPSMAGNPPISADAVQDTYFGNTFPKAAVIPINDFSLGEESVINIGSAAGGAGAGKAALHELQVSKSLDKVSRSLFAMSATGGHVSKMQLNIRKTGATGGKPYLVFGFDMVFVSKIEWSGGGDVPTEQVTFAYGALALGYYPQKADGTLDIPVKASWSQVTNTDPGADAMLAGF